MYLIRGWDNLTYENTTWLISEDLHHAKAFLKKLSLIKAYGEIRYTELKLYKEVEI